ncbi:MAG: hypothetical protein E6J02_14200 [Chloroflexi bacterium]|nr:MAG: hypothetical protein E6J02_14200 [Chloroflexota bacterium]
MTLDPIDQLETQIASLQAEAAMVGKRVDELKTAAEDKLAKGGLTLLANRDKWDSSPVSALVEQAQGEIDRTQRDDYARGQETAPTGSAVKDLWKRLRTYDDRKRLQHDQTDAQSHLRSLAIQIARSPAATTFPLAAELCRQGSSLEADAASAEAQLFELQSKLKSLSHELQERRDAIATMGFDSLYLAAQLEEAHLVLPATLCRRRTKTQWIGGSQGVSFPIGHTGIRYRLGSFHGHPIQQEYLAIVDTGSIVVTNQRIAFVGNVKSLAVSLTKLLHVETYKDGVAVFREGKEDPDIYRLGSPNQLVFYLNYELDRSADQP